MFGASLGKVQQRKVEKKASSQLGANDSSRVESSVFGFLDIQAALNAIPTSESGGDEGKMRKRLPKGTKPILYSADKGAGPDVMLKFFHAVTDMLMDPENIREIVAESNANNVPLFVQSMNFQKDVLEYNFQIEREYGCAQLGLVAVKYPDNPELVAAAKKFMLVAMESYVEQVKYRAAERFQKIRKASGLKENANVLRTAGGMTKQDYLEFFEACNAVMPLPHTRAALKKEFEVSGEKFEQVGKMAIAIQHRMLELIGVDYRYGVQCLNQVGQLHRTDAEIQMKFMSFQVCAELYCKLASFTPEKEMAFLAEVPAYMRDFPHIFFIKKQHMMNEANARGGPMAGSQRMAPDDPRISEEQRKLFGLLSSEEGAKSISDLFQRVNTSKDDVIKDIEAMDASARQAYFDGFKSQSITAELKNIKPENATESLQKFTSMSQEDLIKVLKMNAVFNADMRSGGTLMKVMKETPDVANSMMHFSQMVRVISQSVMQQQQQQQGGQGGQGGHDHSHGHGHGHGHGGHGGQPPAGGGHAGGHGGHDHSHDHNGNCVTGGAPKAKPNMESGDAMER
jgi:hypothetical protein